MVCLIFEYLNLYLWCQILAKFDVNQIWLTTWLFVYVPASDHKTDPSGKKICFVGWPVGQHAPVKVTKHNLQFFNWKLIVVVECILRYFSNKSAFDDKLKVCRRAGIGIYVLFACTVLRQTHVLLIAVYISDTRYEIYFPCLLFFLFC